MFPRRFALISGIVMLALGVIALIPQMAGSIEGLPLLRVEQSYGWFLGLFAMNIFNKLALIAFGLGGLYAYSNEPTSLPKSILFSRILFYAMGVLAVLGLFPQTNTLNGYWPLFGADAALHAVGAAMGAYFGYALSAQVKPQDAPKRFDGPIHAR